MILCDYSLLPKLCRLPLIWLHPHQCQGSTVLCMILGIYSLDPFGREVAIAHKPTPLIPVYPSLAQGNPLT
ncbi:uncharacterized protein BDV17DRAFT_272929 [Aspergillus undulatus]|uniref:uncharacterized protein n=1 Tax=Aspergillus undulatus TaxID=1810928 RepID=UPI003CCDE0EE